MFTHVVMFKLKGETAVAAPAINPKRISNATGEGSQTRPVRITFQTRKLQFRAGTCGRK